MVYELSFLFFIFILKTGYQRPECFSVLKWGHGTGSHRQQRFSRVMEDNSFPHLCFSFGYSCGRQKQVCDAHKTYICLPTTDYELKKKTSIKQKAHTYMLIMYTKQIYVTVTSKPLIYARTCWKVMLTEFFHV